ncbi:MAG: OST-HTH/LOTUS domain-containing protein [Bacteroidetes bacterium]|nr:OST-HTH/LOTUS domain-containing protein [Bacteroidota bacterium]
MLEIIPKDEKPEKESIILDKKQPSRQKNNKKEAPISNINRDILKLITESINDIADENGWAFLGDLGNFLIKRKPDFDARNYGYPKLFALVKGLNKFDFEERDAAKATPNKYM